MQFPGAKAKERNESIRKWLDKNKKVFRRTFREQLLKNRFLRPILSRLPMFGPTFPSE
jgi:hypothetical protein